MAQMFYQTEPAYIKEIPEGCVRCDHCGEIVAENETIYLDSRNVCQDCLGDFCNRYVEDFGDEYIAAHRKEFCFEWILPRYSEEDIVRAILTDYEQRKKLDIASGSYGAEYTKKNEQEFCLESSDWEDFVKERL